jgi:energy-coupling factor transporter ATP-binding protein EcfA2
MPSLLINHHRFTAHSAKQALRAHVEQLSPAKQREFIDCALHLIAERILLDEVEAQLSPSSHAERKPTTFN